MGLPCPSESQKHVLVEPISNLAEIDASPSKPGKVTIESIRSTVTTDSETLSTFMSYCSWWHHFPRQTALLPRIASRSPGKQRKE